MTLSTTREWDSFKGYCFGLADEQEGEATRMPLTGLPLIGDDGKATFPVTIDQAPSTTRFVNAAVTVRMREAGGRAVERSLDIAIRPDADMIGITPGFCRRRSPAGRHGEVLRHRSRIPTASARPFPARCGSWSRSSGTISGTAPAITGTTSR